MKNDNLTAEFMTLLRVPMMEPTKRTATLQARLIGLGFGKTCTRCGGCGNYSYCAMYGTRCFGCNGSGNMAQKLTKALYAEVSAAVAAGKLDEYLTNLRAKNAAIKDARTATDRVMAAWQASGVSQAYKWQNACEPAQFPKDAAIARNINEPMYHAYNHVDKLAGELRSTQLKPVATAEEREARDAEVLVKRAKLLAATEAALELIARKTAELASYL